MTGSTRCAQRCMVTLDEMSSFSLNLMLRRPLQFVLCFVVTSTIELYKLAFDTGEGPPRRTRCPARNRCADYTGVVGRLGRGWRDPGPLASGEGHLPESNTKIEGSKSAAHRMCLRAALVCNDGLEGSERQFGSKPTRPSGLPKSAKAPRGLLEGDREASCFELSSSCLIRAGE